MSFTARPAAAMLAVFVIAFSTSSYAACYAVNQVTGEEVQAREGPGDSFAWAHASWGPDGWPTITYGPTYYQLPTLMKRFTRLHECGHLVNQSVDEIEANCYALENGDWSSSDTRSIGNFHRSVGVIAPQYGGTGAAFWALTTERCPEFAEPEE